MQTITSKNTSRVQIPGLHKTPIAKAACMNSHVLDYGAGLSHELAREQVLQNGAISYEWYDPYWNSNAGNGHALLSGPYDVVLCANVLNVINDDESMYQAVYQMLAHVRHDEQGNGVVLITVYEGDKSGQGRITRDGYQRNLRASAYVDMLQARFDSDYAPEKPAITVYRAGRVICVRFKNACEMCELKGPEICRMCTDVDGAGRHPYYDVSELVNHNPAPGFSPIARLTDFSDLKQNRAYASALFRAWNRSCNSADYEAIGNAFAQVREKYVGVID